ncbi:SDR family oxidoreductase [Gracilimonas mengyeensis]|uniref:Dihydroflavonol-4-reductase n=1 Tax=Gracilimonas mengyeensis TaxID=1302730 RepID=A0A521DRD0_9BACT|nr:aldehyde reductase [Gracilimonas mengyeensis]SMO74283.1 dihydroflavonol-4-reductase [Gracilimonas mengyeensis]
MDTNKKVLLTGITGFLGSHTAIKLLEKGYKVIGSLRNMERANHIKKIIGERTDRVDRLQFAEADLLDDKVWRGLVEGIDFVQHIASPFPRKLPDNEEELIKPARGGTLNILQAAEAHNVKRVVITSSTGSIVYGKQKGHRSGTFSEEDWTNVQNKKDTTPYFRSKTIAEQAAWEFMEKERRDMELAVVCPGAILGPVLEKDFGTSANIVIKMLDGSTPVLPDIGFDIVDVRSVADLLIRAMEQPEAAGQRFIGSAGYLKFKDVADILREAYPSKKIPRRVAPDFMVRLFSYVDASLKPILIDLGVERKVDHSKAKRLLNWTPIPKEEAVRACAESVLKLEIV